MEKRSMNPFSVRRSLRYRVGQTIGECSEPTVYLEEIEFFRSRLWPERSVLKLSCLKKIDVEKTKNKEPYCDHMLESDRFISYLGDMKSEQNLCEACETGKVIGQNSDRKRSREFDPTWTREKGSFEVETASIFDLDPVKLKQIAEFCEATGLTSTAIEHFEEIASGVEKEILLVNEISLEEIVGFAIYDKNYGNGNLLKKRVLRHLESAGWLPQSEISPSKAEWLDLVVEKIDELNNPGKNLTYDDVDDIGPDLIGTMVESFKSHLFGQEESLLQDNLGDLVRWIYMYETTEEPIIPEVAEIKLHLICADPDWSGYGILKGSLRFIQNELVSFAEQNKSDVRIARLRLTAVNKEKFVMYRAHGMKRDTGKGATQYDMKSDNLLTHGLLVEETQGTKKLKN